MPDHKLGMISNFFVRVVTSVTMAAVERMSASEPAFPHLLCTCGLRRKQIEGARGGSQRERERVWEREREGDKQTVKERGKAREKEREREKARGRSQRVESDFSFRFMSTIHSWNALYSRFSEWII